MSYRLLILLSAIVGQNGKDCLSKDERFSIISSETTLPVVPYTVNFFKKTCSMQQIRFIYSHNIYAERTVLLAGYAASR